MLAVNRISNSPTLTFGMRIPDNRYTRSYEKHPNYNGYVPDSFILSRLTEQYRTPQNAAILDLGAGQGRNTIPIAKMGFRVFPVEINDEGKMAIQSTAFEENLHNIKVIIGNILDPLRLRIAEDIDFAFMSHVSQHFSVEEMKRVFDNVGSVLKDGGEFVFDALLRTDKSYKKYEKMPYFMRPLKIDEYGAASFEEEEIAKIAEQTGFKFLLKTPFVENNGLRAVYEYQSLWGSKGRHFKPVKLNWFVFRK